MKRFLMALVVLVLSAPVFAAKWNSVTGDDLKALYAGTVMTGRHEGTSFTFHNCADNLRSFMKFGDKDITERVQTFPSNSEVCFEDERGNRCYNIFQHAKKPVKLKFEGTNVSSDGKLKLTDKSPDWCS